MKNGIMSKNGVEVTEAMINDICVALDRNEWPEGWENVGSIVRGHAGTANSENISFKVTPSMKQAIAEQASKEGVSTSAYVRGAVARALTFAG